MKQVNFISIIAAVISIFAGNAIAVSADIVHPFEIFTNNGSYYNSPNLDLYVQLTDRQHQIDFTFYNQSLLQSSIARIYFDSGGLLDKIAAVTEGPGTSFSQPATPANLPAGNTLQLPFVTTPGFSIGSNTPRSHNGINPGQWLQITCDLTNASTFATVIDQLNTGDLRIGIHIIALPDGSSESAIAVPEPATIVLLGLGTLALLIKRRA